MDAEVIVVGAGPAGSWLAYQLAARGRQVLIVEREEHPRYKACGGALSGKSTTLLNRTVGIDESLIETTRVSEIVFRCNDRDPVRVTYEGHPFLLVMRSQFDHYLIGKAVEQGAVLKTRTTVKDLEPTFGGIRVATDRGAFTGQAVVGADGANSVTRRRLTSDGGRGYRRVAAVEAEVDGIEHERKAICIDYGLVKKGYCWVFPKQNHISTGMGMMKRTGGRRRLRNALQRYLEKLDVSENGSRVTLYGHVIPVYSREAERIPTGGKRYLLVGDAAFLADPFLGEGIYYALKSAELAAEVLDNACRCGKYDLSGYSDVLKDVLYPELRLAETVSRYFYRSPILYHRALCREPEIGNIFIDALQGADKGFDVIHDLLKHRLLHIIRNLVL